MEINCDFTRVFKKFVHQNHDDCVLGGSICVIPSSSSVVVSFFTPASIRTKGGGNTVSHSTGKFSRLDALVVNAGIWIADEMPVHAMTLEQWRRTMDTDLTGAFLSCRGFLRHIADVPRDDANASG